MDNTATNNILANERRVTRSKSRKFRETGGQICRVIITRNGIMDKVALTRPGRRIQRSQSMNNLNTVLPGTSPKHQLDMLKIRSILKKPTDKPRIIFGRRKSMSSSVTFRLDPQAEENIESMNNASSQDETLAGPLVEEPLIDFFLHENSESNGNNAVTNVVSMLSDEILQPACQINGAEAQSIPPDNQNIFDEFDPFKGPVPSAHVGNSNGLNSTDWSSILQSELSSNNLDTNNLTSGNDIPISNGPLPNFIPIKSIARNQHFKNIASISSNDNVSPAVNRPLPKLMPIKAVTHNTYAIPSTSMSNKSSATVRRELPGLLPANLFVRRTCGTKNNLTILEKSSVDDSTLDEMVQFDSSGEDFGKLRFDFSSDSD